MPPDPALLAQADAAADAYGIPRDLFRAQIGQESSWNPNAVNPAWPVSQGGPAGIAQFTVGTAKQYGLNPFDAVQSLWGAARYNYDLYKKTGSWLKVLKSYGTIPASGALTTSQQQVADLAVKADQGLLTPTTGPAPATPPSTTPPASTPAPATGPVPTPSQVGGVIQSAFSSLYNVLIRGGLILLGVVIIWQGLAMMRNTTIVEQVKYVRSKVGSRKEAA